MWNISAKRHTASLIKDGKTPGTPSVIRTAPWRRHRLRSARCRVTCTRRRWRLHVATRLDRGDVAAGLRERAEKLKVAFARDFWLEEEQTVALALDADKRPCRVMSSNAAHCLATGLLDGGQAAAMSARLLSDDMFSGWGFRTLGSRERRYNPMSYHNGSVWPHDNGVAAMGLARAGNSAGVLRTLDGLFDAAVQLHTGSLPELFC